MKKILLFIILIGIFTSCGSQVQWVEYKGNGYSMQIPQNMNIQLDNNGIIRVSDGTQNIHIWNFCILNMHNVEINTILNLIKRNWTISNIVNITEVNKGLYRIQTISSNFKSLFLIKINAINEGQFIQLYSFNYNNINFEIAKNNFIKILKSFKIENERKQQIEYKTYIDPKEQSFSIKVPANYNINGSLYRYSAIDVRTELHINSPNNDFQMFIGDQKLPTFRTLDAMLQFAGYKEGMWFNAGVGSSIYISRYLPGIDFLREYISLNNYKNIVETDSKKFIDLANQLTIVQNRQFAGMAIVRYDLGEYHYTFNKNNEPWIGTAVIATSLNKLSQGQLELWNVNYIAGFVCKANVENESSEVFKNISKTFQSDSEWVKRQNQTTLKISGIISDLGEYQSKIYKEIYETKSKTNEEQSKSFSNYLRGVEIVLDKTTGEKYEVKSGRDYYWINKMKNQYVGTDTYANPDQMNLEEVIIIR